jgi:FkbM family methyltransferase
MISTKPERFIFKNANFEYVIFNFDYFVTDYKIKARTNLNEMKDYTMMLDLVRKMDKSRSVLDVGANCGMFSIPAEKYGYSVLSVEPLSMNVSLLEQSKSANSCKNMQILNFALFDSDTTQEIFIPYCSDNASFNKEVAISNMNSKNYITEQVVCKKLDTFLLENPSYDIGLIKIDVQGFEMNVLKGMSDFLEKANNLTLIIEWDQKHTVQAGNSLDEMMAFLTQKGFINTVSFPGDKIFEKNKRKL